MAPRVLISHRSSDPSVPERVAQLLVEAAGVRWEDIRIAGGGAAAAREIREAAAFVALITADGGSALFEAGARWGADRDVLLLLGPGATADALPAALAHRPVARMDDQATLVQLAGAVARELAKQTPTSAEGFCIRCRVEIPLDLERPYCVEDYDVWAQTQNRTFEDRFCHRCGKSYPATKAQPLCGECRAAASASR